MQTCLGWLHAKLPRLASHNCTGAGYTESCLGGLHVTLPGLALHYLAWTDAMQRCWERLYLFIIREFLCYFVLLHFNWLTKSLNK